MTLFDFLSQAGFWQWVGMLCLGTLVAQAIIGAAQFRIWGNITNIYKGEKEDDK